MEVRVYKGDHVPGVWPTEAAKTTQPKIMTLWPKEKDLS